MPLDDLLPHIRERIECIYEDPANSVGFESAEGGYQLSTMDSYEILDDVGLGVDNDDLREELAGALDGSEWVHRNPYSLPEEDALRMSWEAFAEQVKHRVRYLLFPAKDDPYNLSEGIEPADLLDALGDTLVRHDLISTLPAGSKVHRVRLHKPGQPPANTLAELGPPPVERAKFSNRMSPAGMSMFYGALDEKTALAETYVRHDGKPAEATIAVFEIVEDLAVLDLTNLPDYPSVFGSDEANLERPAINLIHAFADDFTQPVEKDGREHVEYVPSQVVTEYVRYRLGEKAGKPIKGVLYPSARSKTGVGCVLFVAHEDIATRFLSDKPLFTLIEDATHTIPVKTKRFRQAKGLRGREF